MTEESYWTRFRWRYVVRFMHIVLLYLASKETFSLNSKAEKLADTLAVVFREDFN